MVAVVPAQPELLFYDGHCGLCHRSVQFLLRHDPGGRAFRFAPLQGCTFEATIPPAQRAQLPDSMVIRTRRALIRAALAFQETGAVPHSVDHPEDFAQRSGGVVLPRHVDWFEATAELRKAFIQHTPDEVQESLGRRPKAETTTA